MKVNLKTKMIVTNGEIEDVIQVRCPCGVCGRGVEATLFYVGHVGSGVIRGGRKYQASWQTGAFHCPSVEIYT